MDGSPATVLTTATKPSQSRPSAWGSRELLHARIPHSARLTYLALADAADNKTGILTINMTALAVRCGTADQPAPRRSIERDLKALIDTRLINEVAAGTRTRGKQISIHVAADRRLEIHLGYFWDGHGLPARHPEAARALTGLLAILNVADFTTGETTLPNSSIAAAAPGRTDSKNRASSVAESHEGPRSARKTVQGWVEALSACAPEKSFVIERTRDAYGNFSTNRYTLNPKALPPYKRAAKAPVASAASERALRALPGWRFMTKATRQVLVQDADCWPRPVLGLAAHLRDGVQAIKDSVGTGKAHDVMISPPWLETLTATLIESGMGAERLGHVIDFALGSSFERANLLGDRHSNPADKLRQHASRIASTSKYAVWREQHGLVEYSDDVHYLCNSLVGLLDYIHDGDKHEVDWRWRRIASTLLKTYSVEEIEDMMEWSINSPRHISNVGKMLLFEWVSEAIRKDNDFIGWSQQKQRPWSMNHRVIAQPEQKFPSSTRKARGQRIGAKVEGNDVFKHYAEATSDATGRSDSEIAAQRADYIAKHPKRRAAMTDSARTRPGFEPIGSIDDD